MKRPLLIFLLSYVSILFFSCGETEKEKAPEKEAKFIKEPTGVIDACSILDKSDIEKILNIKMKEPKGGRSQDGEKKNISFSECSFESDTGDTKIYLSIYIRFSPFKEDAYTTMRNVRSSFKQSGIDVYNVAGTGDVAFWGRNQLHVFEGDNYYLIITLLGMEQDDSIAKAKTVVLQVIEKLNSL